MSCTTCGHTMQQLGCCNDTGLAFFWCPRCGTIKPCDGEGTAPALVLRCREFQERLILVTAGDARPWDTLGVRESINRPGERS